MFATDLLIAARNLTRHRRRNLLLGGAIAAVTALLVLLGGLTAGMRDAMLESATTLMTGHVNVGGFYKITAGSAAPLVTDYPRVLEEVRRRVPELDYVTVRGRGWGKVVSDTSSMDMVLGGVDVAREPGIRRVLRVVEGNLDDLAQPRTMLLFEDQAKRLSVKVGDALTIAAPTSRGMNNTADVKVAVIARNVGLLSAFNGFLPAETLRQLYQLNDRTTGAIQLYLKDARRSSAVAERLRQELRAAGFAVLDADPQPYWQKLFQTIPSADWTGGRLDLSTWEDEMSFMSWILRAVQGLTGLLVFVLMVIVVIGILNTLAIAIRERTREIGTLRAIGMQRRKVLWLFLLETLLLGLGGTVAGALAGAGVGAILNAARIGVPESVQMFLMQQRLTLTLDPTAIAARVALLTAVTTVASLFPALRAARLAPVTAMHHVG
ncbi:MAG TPA: FtsX-like permease family protein [Anaeromyxobacteraceae bacterium]|nr:FtsX-like permease family protein [Anaeromyxobacteraceae bacterium]